jgi:nitrate/nitrite transporter NarK
LSSLLPAPVDGPVLWDMKSLKLRTAVQTKATRVDPKVRCWQHNPAAAAAASIAWINSLGNLGGFFGPWYVGVMKDATGSFAGGLYGLALLGLIASFVCAFFLHIPNPAASVLVLVPSTQSD